VKMGEYFRGVKCNFLNVKFRELDVDALREES
jgi:hypothetical protein